MKLNQNKRPTPTWLILLAWVPFAMALALLGGIVVSSCSMHSTHAQVIPVTQVVLPPSVESHGLYFPFIGKETK